MPRLLLGCDLSVLVGSVLDSEGAVPVRLSGWPIGFRTWKCVGCKLHILEFLSAMIQCLSEFAHTLLGIIREEFAIAGFDHRVVVAPSLLIELYVGFGPYVLATNFFRERNLFTGKLLHRGRVAAARRC